MANNHSASAFVANTFKPVADEKGLIASPPASLADALELITSMSIMLDFFMKRSGNYQLLQLLTKNAIDYWSLVAKHVATREGILLSALSPNSLTLSTILEAMHVFCNMLLADNIPDQYAYYCAGFNAEGAIALLADIGKLNLTFTTQPEKDLGILFGEFLAKSAQAAAKQGG